ncbi:MAG: hypothetical protein AAGB32_05475, partial [Pseudomonadota bacterium]
AETLSGIHEDAVRCVFDERLNRLKRLSDRPSEQLGAFVSVSDDAIQFWRATAEFPEDRPGRRQQLSEKLRGFFDRVIRYAEHHQDSNLSSTETKIKKRVIQQATSHKATLAA